MKTSAIKGKGMKTTEKKITIYQRFTTGVRNQSCFTTLYRRFLSIRAEVCDSFLNFVAKV